MKIHDISMAVFLFLATFIAANLPSCEGDKEEQKSPTQLEVIDVQTEIEFIEVIY